MPELKREVKPVEVNYVCDSCGNGMMTPCGDMDPKTGNIDHRCMICDHQQVFQWRPYPRIEHIGMEEKL